MKLSSVVKALGSLCLLVGDAFPVLHQDCPEIIGPQRVHIKTQLGDRLVLHCDAYTNCGEDEALIYWLVDDSFPEETLSSDRIVESSETALEDGAIVQRSLLLKNVTSEDFKSTFKCVVTNALGIVQKQITLTTTGGGCCHGSANHSHSH